MSDAPEAREESDDLDGAEAGDGAESSDDDGDDITRFIQVIDVRYQLLYSRVTLVALLGLIGVCIAFVWMLDGWFVIGTSIVGSLFLALFAMRTAVHLAARSLTSEVDRFTESRPSLSLDDLIARARAMNGRADFFVSLTDGPLARQARARDAARATASEGSEG